MLHVLITGANSYIGTNLYDALSNASESFCVDVLDTKKDWNVDAFRGVDAVIHVAGLAHMRETAENRGQYFAVNRDLALRAARLAKESGVRQFVFFSSMSVYGLTCGHIDAGTPTKPVTAYGQSKLEAEQGLKTLADDDFHIAVLRPPMIYGRGCRGNYPRLSGLIRKLPAFPSVKSERSMLYIGCLCGFVRRLLLSGEGGLFFPQNREYVSVNELAREISRCAGRRLWQPCGLGWLLTGLGRRVTLIGKVFGTLVYDHALSTAFSDEPQPAFAETIRMTEAEE